MFRIRISAVPALAAALAALAFSASAAAAGKDVKIAHVYSKTGALQAYGQQTQTGLMLGFDYATGGTMMVNGRRIVLIEKDDQGKPDVGKSLLAAAYGDDKADIAVGPTSSGVASPETIRSLIFFIHKLPSRHGVHWPQAS